MQKSLKKLMSSSSSRRLKGSFSELKFDCRALRELPVNDSYSKKQRDVPNAIFALVRPTPIKEPKLIAYSESVAHDLLEMEINPQVDAPYLAGCVEDFGETAAHCYAGHQFGYFSGQLGDGATMYLGEIVNSKGERWELQFKGAGLTPFSRQADGRKVLRSSIREFLASEHLHTLGIKTTRALSICTSETKVVRDMFYDGHPTLENCAVIVRVAESFLRFGSFELAKTTDKYTGRAGPSPRNFDLIKTLVDYTRSKFYSELETDEEFVFEVARRTAVMIAGWQSVGFCHGVMNTDNMSILGLTLDYGPYGFVEKYDPEFVPNTSDPQGTYRFERQPTIGLFNLKVLSKELSNAGIKFDEAEMDKIYRDAFFQHYRAAMFTKLGLEAPKNESNELFFELLTVMRVTAADYTMTFRALAKMQSAEDFQAHLAQCLDTNSEEAEQKWKPWLEKYFAQVQAGGDRAKQLRAEMNKVNPVFVLRNYIAQRAIDQAEQGDYNELQRVFEFCANPYTETPQLLEGKYDRPNKAMKCNAVSCSS